MQRLISRRPLPTLLSIVMALWLLPVTVQAQNDLDSPCNASLDPAAVTVGTGEVEVTAELTNWLGDVLRVDVPEGSGLAVIGLDNTDTEFLTFRVVTENAELGQWRLTIVGDLGSCLGVLTVQPAEVEAEPPQPPTAEPADPEGEPVEPAEPLDEPANPPDGQS